MPTNPYLTNEGSDPLWRREMSTVVLSYAGVATVLMCEDSPELNGVTGNSVSPQQHVAVLLDHLTRNGEFPPGARTNHVTHPENPGLRGVLLIVDAATFEVRRPNPCPHGPHPLGDCTHPDRGVDPVPRHQMLHLAECGCTCSGVLRWEHQPAERIPLGHAGISARVLFEHTWEYFDEFSHRITRSREWLTLWVEMFDPQLSFAEMDSLCDTALKEER